MFYLCTEGRWTRLFPCRAASLEVSYSKGGNRMQQCRWLIAVAAVPLWAQPWAIEQVRLTGGDPDSGKCTAAVEVDGTAEIEIEGLQGRMRTISGEPAKWQRLDCRAALPPSAREFRFVPQDGGGDQYLVREPRQNGGVALIRIEDSGRGSSVYTFDLEWTGSGGLITTAPTDGFQGGGFAGGGLITPQAGPAPDGWNDEIRFHAGGDGYYHSFNHTDALLSECAVAVQPDGKVRIEFQTNQPYTLLLTGRLVHVARNRLVASVSGGGIDGTMEISTARGKRVKSISMTGAGRDRFDLRWQAE